MKKIICVFTTLAMILSLTLFLSSCGVTPELDMKSAQNSMENLGYLVYYYTHDSELDAGTVAAFTATKATGTDYLYIIEYDDAKLAKMVYNTVVSENNAKIKYTKQQIEILEYKLKRYEGEITSTEKEEIKESIRQFKSELNDYENNYYYGIDGKIVWFGTANAIEDSKS